MFKKAVLTTSASILAASTIFAAADRFTIDPAHSSIGFGVKHLMVSNVKGEFADFAGTIMFDETDPAKSSVEVTIKAGSIDTRNTNRDNHLRSADFFDVQNFPDIIFKSNKVEKTSDGYMIYGNFTMRGVTKAIFFPVTFNGKITGPKGETRVGFDAATELNRKDYGVNWNKTLDAGGVVVSEGVKIELNVEAVKE